ncbi:MAG: hypothetical protein QOK29_2635, partial [Rhodospirillaceae bacterium]|nr:hypothetical protein [Rhodospirillaceae bacterium]
MRFAVAVATAVVLASSLASAQSGGKPLRV